ncbi:MAG TPA: Ig-like domain-containing protein [Candidatus Paceibacterota bacterium]|jgi:hypothetical protein|nr:Ig-like domain-containing protein [Candidatus Paceibacterota bacterium]
MKKKNMLWVLAFVALLVGCGTKPPVTSDPTSESPTTSHVSTTSEEDPTSQEDPTSEVVLNPAIAIEEGERSLYITKSIVLTATVTDSTDAVVWSTSDEDIATVNDGVVTGVAPGEVTITAALAGSPTIKDSVEVTVIDTIIDATINPTAWDFERIYQAEPVIETVSQENTNDIKTYASFKNIKGKVYGVAATFNVKSVGDWVWNTMTIGHIDGNGQIYATGLSQNPTKLITQYSKTVGGVEQQWGVLSDRSQIWHQHDLQSLDCLSGVVVTSIRHNGDFYFYINGELYWKDSISFNDLNEVDTTPVIYLNCVDASVSEFQVVTNEALIEELVNYPASQRKLYPTFSEHVEINNNDTSVQFKNADTVTTNNKDVAAKSIGDAHAFPAGKVSKIEFDLVIDAWGSIDATPVVSVDMRRQDRDVAETRSYLIGETGVSFAGWNYNANMPGGYPAGETKYHNGETNVKMLEAKSYRVICTRLMPEGGQDTKIEVYDGELLLATATHGWNDNYNGNAVVFLSVRNVNATLTNIAITVTE